MKVITSWNYVLYHMHGILEPISLHFLSHPVWQKKKKKEKEEQDEHA